MPRLSLRECSKLFRSRFLLVLGFPVCEWLAIDACACFHLAHCEAALGSRFAIPVGHAVAAEAGEDHEVYILHIGPLLIEMRQQAAESGGFEFAVRSRHGCGVFWR